MTISVTFVEKGDTIKTIADADVGLSLMEVARNAGVLGITADCGGACACATCHVYVDAGWRDQVGEPDDIENMTLDLAYDRRPESRLSCQIELRPALDGLVVTVGPM